MTTVRLFSAKACPFAHRTRLVLAEKGVGFELTEIDLSNKPKDFAAVSAYGKVPAIEHDGNRLYESAVINEYLDEVFATPPLLPKDAVQRALARIWIDYANTRFAPAFGALLRAESAAAEGAAKTAFDESLDYIEREALGKLSGAGPFWFGSSIGLVDLAFYPWFERLPALQHYRDYVVPKHLVRLQVWREAISKRPSAQGQQGSAEYYIERYARFARQAA
ncbi:MAG TPA: glutathione S-transferase family protein [Polyangiaceae bacterium]|jgi:glutathione S-transferase|nr:glutathione S-transferase family protein [Polyangiaceae bacterium]